MSGITRSREYKLDAVHKFLAQDKSAIKFAATLGISNTALSQWVREYKETGDIHVPKGTNVPLGRRKMVQLGLVVPPVIASWLETRAEKCNITKSEYVRSALVSMYRKAKAKEAQA